MAFHNLFGLFEIVNLMRTHICHIIALVFPFQRGLTGDETNQERD